MTHFKKILRFVISALLIYVLLKGIDFKSLAILFSHIKLVWIVYALLLSPLAIYALSLRLKLLSGSLDFKINLINLFRLTWISSFFNLFLPGATGGDIYKVYYLTKHFQSADQSLSILICDRIYGVGILLLIGIIGLLAQYSSFTFVFDYISYHNLLRYGVVLSLSICFLLLLALYVSKSKAGSFLDKFKLHILNMLVTIRLTFLDKRTVVQVSTLSVLVHFISFTITYFLCRSLNVDISFFQLLVFIPAASLICALPVTVYGIGLREVLWVSFFQLNHATCGVGFGYRESAIAVSFLTLVLDFVRVLPGGLWYILMSDTDASVVNTSV